MANLDKNQVFELQSATLNRGIESNGKNIDPEFCLSEETINVHINENSGIGPRYGMQPVPYHSLIDVDNPEPPAQQTKAGKPLRYSQYNAKTPNGAGRINLAQALGVTKIFALYPVPILTESSNFQKQEICYFAVTNCQLFDTVYGPIGPFPATTTQHQKCIHVGIFGELFTYEIGQYSTSYATSEKGFDRPYFVDLYRTDFIFSEQLALNPQIASDKYKIDDGKLFYQTSFFSVSGQTYPFENILGYNDDFVQSNTTPGEIRLEAHNKEVLNGSFAFQNRKYQIKYFSGPVFIAGASYRLLKKFVYENYKITNLTTDNNYILPPGNFGSTIKNSKFLGTPTSTTIGVAASVEKKVLFQMKGMTIDSGYLAFAIAKKEPILCIHQNSSQNRIDRGLPQAANSTNVQSYNPCKLYLEPVNDVPNNYGVPYNFSSLVQPTPIPSATNSSFDGLFPNSVNRVATGGPNTGTLRKSTNYQIGYSVFDKSTGVECNVKSMFYCATNATDDFTCITIYRAQLNNFINCPITYNGDFEPVFNQADLSMIKSVGSVDLSLKNDISNFQYRFFFRQVGDFEWLPSVQIDVLEFYMDSDLREVSVGKAPIAAIPGGQPGAFVDNSSLPVDDWFDTKSFQNYLFWCSSKSLVWSNKNNPFTYPVLNSINIPSGYAKGILQHAYPGQAVQDSRMLLFTSEGIYAGRFTGQFDQMQIRISPTESATFDRPGSDFALRFWTSITAFSSRAAIVANGVLYFWGQNGVYRDGGNELPVKDFSYKIEPWVHGIYDKSKTDEIHGVYNDKTKEVIWFFRPATPTSAYQKALVYNTQWDTFHVFDFGTTLIHNAQLVDIQFSSKVNTGITGNRVVLYITDAIQTAEPMQMVFFDEKCNTGDLTTKNIAMCKQITDQGSNKKLKISILNGVALPVANVSRVTINNVNAYFNSSFEQSADGLYNVVSAAYTGTNEAEIVIAPIDTTFPASFPPSFGIGEKQRFPVSWESAHGFNYVFASDYWAPGGLSQYYRWHYCHTLFQVSNLLLPSDVNGNKIKLKFYSIVGTGNSERLLSVKDNCRGNFQAHSQIVPSKQNTESQAMAIQITTTNGKFCGSRWAIQYIGYHVVPLSNGVLRTWEN